MKKCILLASIFAVATVYADLSENNLDSKYKYSYANISTTVVFHNESSRTVSFNLESKNGGANSDNKIEGFLFDSSSDITLNPRDSDRVNLMAQASASDGSRLPNNVNFDGCIYIGPNQDSYINLKGQDESIDKVITGNGSPNCIYGASPLDTVPNPQIYSLILIHLKDMNSAASCDGV
jgi:hypothetical protein